jgi:hypothetical protein
MSTCPNCQAQVLQDARFCEACGWKLDEPVPETPQDRPRAKGSLRAEIPLLSGAVRQIRARVEGYRERSERKRRKIQERNQEQQDSTPSRGRTFLGILAGLALLILWAWLLIRGVRGQAVSDEMQWLRLLGIPGF